VKEILTPNYLFGVSGNEVKKSYNLVKGSFMTHTLKLDIDETIYEKFMSLLELMPKGKVVVKDDIVQDTSSLKLSSHFEKITSEDDELLQKLAR
jgi:hypothetical protein